MVNCLFCQKEIENPRKYKGEVVQKFCSDGHRYNYHNRINKEERDFGREVVLTLKKFPEIKETVK
jgi:hypothetical protein